MKSFLRAKAARAVTVLVATPLTFVTITPLAPAAGQGPLASSIAVAWQRTALRTITETVPTVAPPVGAMYLSFMSLAMHDAARRALPMGTHAAAAAVATAAHDVLYEYFPPPGPGSTPTWLLRWRGSPTDVGRPPACTWVRRPPTG